MNRFMVIPAIGSVVIFAGVLAFFHNAPARERTSNTQQSYAPAERISFAEAEEQLTKLTGDYLRPWREYENSPRRLYSRAAPRPIPSISASIELATTAEERKTMQTDNLLVATVVIKTGPQMQRIPCVIDRQGNDVRLFASDQWVTAKEWLMMAPMP